MDRKFRPSLTKDELYYLQHILRHFTDYMGHDDRPDHGFGILKGYRDLPQETKSIIYQMTGKIVRLHRKQPL